MTVRYEGERGIYLRELQEEDIDDRYIGWFDDKAHIRFYSGSGKAFDRQSVLARFRASRATGNDHEFGVFDAETDLCFGNVRIGPVDLRNLTSDLVTLIGDPAYLGRGLASAAIRVGNRIAFEVLGIRKLHSGMYAANVGSIKAYTRADWVVDGCLPGHYLVDGEPMDRILVACYNPACFDLDALAARRGHLVIEW